MARSVPLGSIPDSDPEFLTNMDKAIDEYVNERRKLFRDVSKFLDHEIMSTQILNPLDGKQLPLRNRGQGGKDFAEIMQEKSEGLGQEHKRLIKVAVDAETSLQNAQEITIGSAAIRESIKVRATIARDSAARALREFESTLEEKKRQCKEAIKTAGRLIQNASVMGSDGQNYTRATINERQKALEMAVKDWKLKYPKPAVASAAGQAASAAREEQIRSLEVLKNFNYNQHLLLKRLASK